MVLLTLLEFFTGWFMEGIRIKLWDYSRYELNYKGYICLRASILWGIASFIFYMVVYPFLARLISELSGNLFIIAVLTMFYSLVAIDFMYTARYVYPEELINLVPFMRKNR